MKHKATKQILSILLAMIMIVGMLPTTALAEDKINQVSLTLDVPVIGQTLDFTPTAYAGIYEITSVRWLKDWGEHGNMICDIYHTVEPGEPYTVRIYINPKEGYSFADLDDVTVTVNGSTDGVTFTHDDLYTGIICSVAFEKLGYAVSFNANGGTGTMDEVTDVYPDYTLPACDFTAPEGKVFNGWTVGSPSGKWYAEGSKLDVNSDVTLYAKWVDPTGSHKITFVNRTTDPYSTVEIIVSEGMYTLPGIEGIFQIPWGSTFDDWEINTGSGYTYYDAGAEISVTEDLEIIATWAYIEYEYISKAVFDVKLNSGAEYKHGMLAGSLSVSLGDVTGSFKEGAAQPISLASGGYGHGYWIVSGDMLLGTDALSTRKGYRLYVKFDIPDDRNVRFNSDDFSLSGDLGNITARNIVSLDGALVAIFVLPAVPGTPLTADVVTFTLGGYAIDQTIPAVTVDSSTAHVVTPYGTCTATRFRPGFSENSYWLTFDLPAILTYTVSFTANGGTGTMADVTGISGEYTLPANGFTAPVGKQFKAWSVGGVEKAVGDKITVTADTTVTAVWETIPAGHTCDIKSVAKVNPSCTEGGKEAYYKCEGCGKFYEDALGTKEITDLASWGNLAKLGHTESDWKSDKDNHWKECTVAGCGVIIENSKVAHTPDRAEATETDAVKCSVCGYVITLALGHTHEVDTTKFESDETNHWNTCSGCSEKQNVSAHEFEWKIDKDATATEKGSKHEECKVCGYRNPILFYTNVCGNVEQEYTRDEIDSQLKTEFISALQPAFGRLSDLELRPNQIISHNTELEEAMNAALSAKWGELRGLQVVSIALGSVTLPEEDAEMIKQAQRTAIMRDPTMAAATLVGAQADAMKAAASNEGGAMNGFIGMGMAMNAGGMNAQNLFAMGQQQTQQTASSAPDADGWKCACGATATGKFCPECGAKKPEPVQSGAWKCKCGATATGKFCPECGSPKTAENGWACSCGAVNKGKFCQNCGARKPEGAPLYRCDKCGWEPEKGTTPPKFCPECGDLFDDNDKK